MGTYAFFFGALEKYDVKVGYPVFELACPVLEGAFWDDYEVGAFDAFVVLEVSEERYGLQCFSQALRRSISLSSG